MSTPARIYNSQLVHYFRKTVNFNDTNIATGVVAGTFPAGAQVVCGVARVITAFNAGTTNVLTAGAASGCNDIFGSSDITEGTPGAYLLAAAANYVYYAAETDFSVKYTQTGTAATTGKAIFSVGFTVDNDG